MGGRYQIWGNVDLYRHTDKLDRKIINSVPDGKITDSILAIEDKYRYRSYPNQNQRLFDIYNLEIIARIAMSGALTCIQLMCFLQLSGYSIDYETVKKRVVELRNINCLSICKIYVSNEKKETECVYLTEFGLRVAKNIGITMVKGGDVYRESTNKGRVEKSLIFVVFNEVIINQMIYSGSTLKSFAISQAFKIKSSKKKIEIPLLLETETNTYLFEAFFSGNYNKYSIINIVNKWICYEENIGKFVPVIMCNSSEQAVKVSELIEKLKFQNKVFITTMNVDSFDKAMDIYFNEKVGKNVLKLKIEHL